MKKINIIIAQFLVSLIPFVYLLIIWHHMPDKVPLHFNSRFEADDYGTKGTLLMVLILMFVVTIGTSLLLINLSKMDPKQKSPDSNPRMLSISWVVVVFLSMTSVFVIFLSSTYSTTGANNHGKYLLFIIALLFVFLGNFISNIKPNYFVGVRTPWALEDPENWRKTHHLASKIWFFGGLVMSILILIFPEQLSFVIFIAGIFLFCAIPIYYSYDLFRLKKKQNM